MKIESVFTLPFVTPKILSAPCSIIDSTHGLFVYQWIAADTNTAGKYSIKFTITEAVGTTITTYTVPTNDKAYVFINNP
jgi:hypothetical protein